MMNNKPFMLRPSGKDYIWGGNRLNDEFEKRIDIKPLAETWECSTHPDGPSYILTGEFAGKTLAEVLKIHPEYIGEHANENGELPTLIKFIDAKNDLSVQVHPTDEYAKTNERGQLGKTEMWYVLDATKNAKIVYGLNHDMTEEELRVTLNEGTLENHLQKVSVKRGDIFFIEAGTIHAIGEGTLVVEIQENSNLTYRIFDYNRADKNGNKRELHVDKAVAVAKLTRSEEPKQPIRVLNYRNGEASELLCRCKYFETYRMIVNTERRQIVAISAGENYRVLLCIGGCGSIGFAGESMNFYKGDCIFIPANSVEIGIHGVAQFLDVRG